MIGAGSVTPFHEHLLCTIGSRLDQRGYLGRQLVAHQLIELVHAPPKCVHVLRVVHGMGLLVADERGAPAQRLGRGPDHRLDVRYLTRRSPVAEQGRIAGGPLHAADELGQRDRTTGCTGGRVGRTCELVTQGGELRSHGRDRLGIGCPFGLCRRQPGHRSDSRRQAATQIVMPRRGPQHHAGGDAGRCRARPAEQPRTDGRDGLGHCNRQHEDEQGGRRRCSGLRRDDPAEEHGESHNRHDADGCPFVGGDDGSQRDQAAPDHPEQHEGKQAGPGAAREVHQQEERKGPQRSQEADLRVGEESMGDTEDRGHDDGGPYRSFDGEESWILTPDPPRQVHPTPPPLADGEVKLPRSRGGWNRSTDHVGRLRGAWGTIAPS